MKQFFRILSSIVLATSTILSCSADVSFTPQGPSRYVRPQTDSHKSRWFFFASASRPFGMVNLSPDNWVKGSWKSGYLYDTLSIRCISHIHGWQIAGVPVMPTTGPMNGHKGMESYKSSFSHESETVHPGYHKFHLDRYDIDVELTSTKRVGFHRYHFPGNGENRVLIDAGAHLAHAPMIDAEVRKVSPRELRGYSEQAATSRRKKPFKVYFCIQFDQDFSHFGGWQDQGPEGRLLEGEEFKGKNSGGYVDFEHLKHEELLMKVGISYVSEEQAALNMAMELPHWNFNEVVKDSYAEWDEALSTIEVKGGTEEQQIKFYTDLWHSLLGRHTFSDADGKYIDNTGDQPIIRQLPLENGQPVRDTYNSDAFWGSEFNLNILWSLAYPQIMNDFAASLTDYYTNGGMIARGPSGGNYTYVMVGDQAVPLIAAAYNKGIRNFDWRTAYKGCLKNSEPGGIRDYVGYNTRPGNYMQQYIENGFVAQKLEGKRMHEESCALTLYFAYEDWCMGQFAAGIGDTANAEKYDKRSSNYKNVYDPAVGWMRPRLKDGSWMKDFAPVGVGSNTPGFVESNSAIFTYYVPHQIENLIELMGGKETFITRLDAQFKKAESGRFITPHGKHAGNWVDYENQPSLHMAHLFNHAGAPWMSQYWVRKVHQTCFSDTTPYGGYNGDEDQGQMGALGVLMAIGLFDVDGGAGINPAYEITTPLFDEITIKLDNRYYPGRELKIKTINNSAENIYIQKAWFNGQEWNSFKIPHALLVQGGELILELGPEPNKNWGI